MELRKGGFHLGVAETPAVRRVSNWCLGLSTQSLSLLSLSLLPFSLSVFHLLFRRTSYRIKYNC